MQPELPFDSAKLARSNDPDTSREAAKRSRGLRGAHHELILRALLDAEESLTAEQIARRVDLSMVQVNRRMGELAAYGYTAQDGIGISSSGRPMRKWRLL